MVKAHSACVKYVIPEISAHGEMVWGVLGDAGGNQWKEPFCAEARVAKARGKIQSYSLKFGKDAPLSEKLVESGSYYALLPKGERVVGVGRGSV